MKTIRTVQIIEDTAMAAAESKERTNKIIKAFIAEIKLNLCKGNSVGLFEFGTFSPKHLAEREGKNPQTGETMHIKGKDTVRFKPSRKFVETLNGKGFNLWLCWEVYKMCHPEMRQVLEWQEEYYKMFCRCPQGGNGATPPGQALKLGRR